LSLFVLGTVSARSQPFTLGASLGIPATRLRGAVDSSDIRYQSYTNRYLIGPTAERRLPLGLEARCSGTTASGAQERFLRASTLRTNGRSSQWEFPLLGKYRLPTNRRAPSSTPASRGTPSRASGNP